MADEETAEAGMGQKFYGFDEDTTAIEIPERLPVLPLRGVVIFPSAIVPLPISRKPSLQLVEQCLARDDKILGLVAQKIADEERPSPEDLFTRGTAGRLLKMLRYPDQSVRILVQGLRRIEITDFVEQEPFYICKTRTLLDEYETSKDLDAIQAHLVNQFAKFEIGRASCRESVENRW